jgi:hypothetical protein
LTRAEHGVHVCFVQSEGRRRTRFTDDFEESGDEVLHSVDGRTRRDRSRGGRGAGFGGFSACVLHSGRSEAVKGIPCSAARAGRGVEQFFYSLARCAEVARPLLVVAAPRALHEEPPRARRRCRLKKRTHQHGSLCCHQPRAWVGLGWSHAVGLGWGDGRGSAAWGP